MENNQRHTETAMNEELSKTYARFQLALAETAQAHLRAQYYQKRIETGTWRERIGKVFEGGFPEHGGIPYSEDRILQDEVQTMHRHIVRAEQHLDYSKSILAEL